MKLIVPSARTMFPINLCWRSTAGLLRLPVDLKRVASIPIYFLLSMEGVPFCRGIEPNTQNPTQKGRPLILRRLLVIWDFRDSHMTKTPFFHH
jgi:hypothetical protein